MSRPRLTASVEWAGTGSRAAVQVGFVLVQLIVLACIAFDARTTEPHRVPVAIVAPGVVAATLADEANALPGHPLEAVPGQDEATATTALLSGEVRGVVVVDLATTTDELLLDAAASTATNSAIAGQIAALGASRERTLTQRLVRADTAETPARLRAAALAGGTLGFLLVLGISYLRGPFARTLRLGVLRLVIVLAAALAGGAAISTGLELRPHQVVAVALFAGLSIATAALVTLALEALAGLAGLALSAAVFLACALPLSLGVDPELLSFPWRTVIPLAPPGATHEAMTAAVLHGDHLATPLAALGTWALLATATLALTRGLANNGAVPIASQDPAAAGDSTASPRVATDGEPHGLRRWRWRVLVVITPAAVLMFGLLIAVDLTGADRLQAASQPPSRASQTECVGTGELRSVADLNRVTAQLRGGPEFQGADVGAGVELQDGRRLMLFGDTLRSPRFNGQRFVRNSMLIVGDGCLRAVLPADRGALVPDRPASGAAAPVGYWPMSVIAERRPGYDLVAVMLQRVRTTGTSAFDFENLGAAVALFVVAVGETPQLLGVRDVGADAPDPATPTWGAAAALDDGWLYLYGTAHPSTNLVFGHSLRVARVRPEQVLENRSWRYWDGNGWAADMKTAVELIPAEGGTSQTLSVFEQDGTWYALSKRDDFLGTDITVWTAPAPWGPFSGGVAVAPLPSDAAMGQLRYMPLAHPDLLPRPGTVVVSYSRNRTDVEQIIADPRLYRPRFLRVRLP